MNFQVSKNDNFKGKQKQVNDISGRHKKWKLNIFTSQTHHFLSRLRTWNEGVVTGTSHIEIDI